MSEDWRYWASASERTDCRILDEHSQPTALAQLGDDELIRILRRVSPPARLKKLNSNWIAAGKPDAANRLQANKTYVFPNYGERVLGDPVNWSLGEPADGNLSWQVHSLPFLRDLASAHSRGGCGWCEGYTLGVLNDWAAANVAEVTPSRFSWNDHSTAIRLTNFGNTFFYFLAQEGVDAGLLRVLLRLAQIHQRVLLDEKFYSKGTNHGLDQAYSLYLSSHFFHVLESSREARRVALERLRYELEKSFAADGVHIENSPEYHGSILMSTLQIDDAVRSMEGGSVFVAGELINKAIDYLALIIRPDGKYPPIGDTLVVEPTQNFEWLKEYSSYPALHYALTRGREGEDLPSWHHVFPDAGYAIFRGDPTRFNQAARPHIVFKCGFLSHYHRQDDDNNLLLFALGEEWLSDGGLYVHDHGVPEREYMRSHLAHNVMAPGGVKAERRHCPEPAPRIVSFSVADQGAFAQGVSTMYPGFRYGRRVDYAGGWDIDILDEMEALDGEAEVFHQYWQIPHQHLVSVGARCFIVMSRTTGNLMVVSVDSGELTDLGLAGTAEGVLGIRSQRYGELEPMSVVRATYRGGRCARAHWHVRLAVTRTIEDS